MYGTITENAVKGSRICKTLLGALRIGPCPAKLHSRFSSAANLTSPFGLVTLLSPKKSLQPWSVVLEQDMDFALLEEEGLSLDQKGIWKTTAGNEALLVSFEDISASDLRLSPESAPIPGEPFFTEAREKLSAFLKLHMEKGVVELAFQRSAGIYAGFLAPRLEAFRRAARGDDGDAVARAARAMAGCGPGLTPSSDDLLCGYLVFMPNKDGKRTAAKKIAESAASRTNDISAALLRRGGEGLFSEDILHLVACLCHNSTGRELTTAMERVAAFGSSSGCDFLTGLYFGMMDFWPQTADDDIRLRYINSN